MQSEADQFVDTLRKLTVDVTRVETVGGVHRFHITNETDARHAHKVMKACRMPRVKTIHPTATSGWIVTAKAGE